MLTACMIIILQCTAMYSIMIMIVTALAKIVAIIETVSRLGGE